MKASPHLSTNPENRSGTSGCYGLRLYAQDSSASHLRLLPTQRSPAATMRDGRHSRNHLVRRWKTARHSRPSHKLTHISHCGTGSLAATAPEAHFGAAVPPARHQFNLTRLTPHGRRGQIIHFSLARLRPLASNTASKLDVLRHDGHTLGVDRAQVRVFKETNQIGLSRLLQGQDGL